MILADKIIIKELINSNPSTRIWLGLQLQSNYIPI